MLHLFFIIKTQVFSSFLFLSVHTLGKIKGLKTAILKPQSRMAGGGETDRLRLWLRRGLRSATRKKTRQKGRRRVNFYGMRQWLDRYKVVLGCAALGLLTIGVYVRVLGSDFVNYDDPVYVTDNKQLQKGLTWENVRWAFTSRYASNWHPLTWLSLMADYEMFGLKPAGYHAVNLAFHVANTLLLFLVLLGLTSRFWESIFAAAVFGLHPLHVESVAWIAERKDVLSGLFWLLTMWAYAGYVRRGGARRYAAALVLFALGLMAKPMLVTLPLVMLLFDWWPFRRRFGRKTLLERLPFVVMAVISSVITLMVQQEWGSVVALERLSVGVRICNALVSYVAYIIQTILPTGLAVYYPHPETFVIWEVAGSVLLLAALTTVVLFLARGRGFLAVGWLWYLGTLVPVIGLVQVGSQSRADRYMYIPMVGLLIMAVWGIGEVVRSRGAWKLAAAVCGVIFIAAFAVGTWVQTGYWKDSRTLWTRALSITEDNCVAHLNFGNVLLKEGKKEEAEGHYRKAVEIYGDYTEGHFNLGLALELEKEYDEAIKEFQTALRLNGRHWKARFHLANALSAKGKIDEALVEYQKAIELRPDDIEVLNNFGLALVQKGRIKDAIGYYQKALSIDENSAEVLNNLGNALVKDKRFDEAVEMFEKTLRLKPDFKEGYYNLANTLRQMDKAAEAEPYYRKAIELNPEDIDSQYGLGLVLMAQNKHKDAAPYFQKCIEQDKNFAQAYYNLGLVFVNAGEIDKAIEQFREVLRLHPNDAEMHCNLGILLEQQGRLEEAIAEFRRATELEPTLQRAKEHLDAAIKKQAGSGS
jgi:tetratricopeptide (TPR) repeat protein